jgi:hypothetical protein
MLENTRALVEAARAAGATIVHAPITFARRGGFRLSPGSSPGVSLGAFAGER